MFIADFHIHSTFSDGELTVREICDLFGSQGIKAIAITDHLVEKNTMIGKIARFFNKSLTEESFPRYMEEIQNEAIRAWKIYNMLVIPGVEITKNQISDDKSAHILALGINRYIEPDHSFIEIINNIHQQDGLAIAAHPVDTKVIEKQHLRLWNERKVLINFFDAWEVASGANLLEDVIKEELPIIANSDFHDKVQFNSWKNVFDCSVEKDDIFAAIKKQDLSFTFFTAQNISTSRKSIFKMNNLSEIQWALN